MKTGQEYTFLRDFVFTHPSMSEALNDLMAFKDYLGTISTNLREEHLRISPKMTNIVPEFYKPQ